jgi:hypothetical protein
VAGLIDMTALAAWCAGQCIGIDNAPTTFTVGPAGVPEFDFPEIQGFVTEFPGGASQMEGIVRLRTVQVRIRTLVQYYDSGRACAEAIDLALTFGNWPANIWGTRILTVGQTGSGPSPTTEDQLSGRLAFTCNYYAEEILQIGVPSP